MGMQFRKDGETIGYELDLRNLQVKPIYALGEDFRGVCENGEFSLRVSGRIQCMRWKYADAC